MYGWKGGVYILVWVYKKGVFFLSFFKMHTLHPPQAQARILKMYTHRRHLRILAFVSATPAPDAPGQKVSQSPHSLGLNAANAGSGRGRLSSTLLAGSRQYHPSLAFVLTTLSVAAA